MKSKLYNSHNISNINIERNSDHFLEFDLDNQDQKTKKDKEIETQMPTVTQKGLIELLCSKKVRMVEDSDNLTNNNIIANGSCHSIVNWSLQEEKVSGNSIKMDIDQRRAFQLIVSKFVLTYVEEAENTNRDNFTSKQNKIFRQNKTKLMKLANKNHQLLLYFGGSGGSGKSEVINQVLKYCKQFCENLGVEFTSSTIRVTALTGVAASNINGETIDSVAGLQRQKDEIFTIDEIYDWKKTRILIIDEISFMSCKKLILLDRNLRKARENYREIYGGINIVFAGDFSQLEPIIKSNKKYGFDGPLYDARGRAKKLWQNAINCYIELKGMHRFKDDLEWGYILRRLREGNPTKADLQEINKHVVTKDTKFPNDIKYGTRFNKVQDSVHCTLFEKYICKQETDKCGKVRDCMIVLCDKMKIAKTGATITNYTNFFQNIGESDCKMQRGRIDPMLKLYKNCELMMTVNDDVRKGKANGTTMKLSKIILKSGAKTSETTIKGEKISIVGASQVKHIIT